MHGEEVSKPATGFFTGTKPFYRLENYFPVLASIKDPLTTNLQT
jgi:hypothetical protein